MEEGIYYKRGTKSDYIGVEILGDTGVIPRVVIEKITFHESLMIQGKRESERWTCKFQGIEKEMLLNATCRKRLAKRFWDTPVADGTPCHGRINLLSGLGLAVRLDSEPCRDPNDGGMTIGLRISRLDPDPAPATQPAQKKVVTEDKVQAARRFYNAGVKDLNTKIKMFPVNLFGGFGFKARAYYEVDESEKAKIEKAPEVKF